MNLSYALGAAADPDGLSLSGMKTALAVLAAEVTRLRAAAIPKDTRKGEWPEAGQMVHCWRCDEWQPHTYRSKYSMRSDLWLLAPPPPEES